MPIDHLAALDAEGRRLVEAVRDVDLDRGVPGLDWDARTVAVHTGSVHRWATDIVRRRLLTNETGGSQAFRPSSLADRDLPAWLGDGLDDLLEVLQSAPVGLQCFTFVPGIEPRTFWSRRQAHETAIHRADVEAAAPAGVVTPVSADFAQDGLAELVGDFAVEAGFHSGRAGALILRATDGPSWRIEFGGPHNVVTSGDAGDLGPADATVTGPSSELYLWAWNRVVPAVTLAGDRAVVELWRTIQVQ